MKNKKRIIAWGIVFILFLVLTLGGVAGYFMGYGESGRLRAAVTPIVKQFNNLDVIKNQESQKKYMKAKASSTGISIKYSDQSHTNVYEFEYKENGAIGYLEGKYDVSNRQEAETVVKSLVDAVSILNKNRPNEVFSRYAYEDFYNTTLADGVRISGEKNTVNVLINTKTNVILNLTAKGFYGTAQTEESYDEEQTEQTEQDENNDEIIEENNVPEISEENTDMTQETNVEEINNQEIINEENNTENLE